MEAYTEQGHCLHKELFAGVWKDEWMDPSFTLAQDLLRREGGCSVATLLGQGVLAEDMPGVFSMPTFSRDLCDMIIAETEHFIAYATANDVPIHRPNSMNRYGLVLGLIGMADTLSDLQTRHLLPLSRVMFPVEGSAFSGHHTFIISYEKSKDRSLDMHTDDSDITWNICLGKEGFTGSGLTFCGRIAEKDHRKFSGTYTHQLGRAVIHSGQQRHGADNILSGERHNMVMWCKNETYRNSELFESRMRQYEKENGPPDEQCLSYTHDRDYVAFKDYPPGQNPYSLDADESSEGEEEDATAPAPAARPQSMPWCPPARFGYDGIFSQNKLMLIHFEKEVEREEGQQRAKRSKTSDI
jgi:hypothetical protein